MDGLRMVWLTESHLWQIPKTRFLRGASHVVTGKRGSNDSDVEAPSRSGVDLSSGLAIIPANFVIHSINSYTLIG